MENTIFTAANCFQEDIKLKIIPLPYSCKTSTGILTVKKIPLSLDNYMSDLKNLGVNFEIVPDLMIDDIKNPEAYTLDIDNNGISVKASSQQGLLYAYTTLCQLLFNYDFNIPFCSIKDYPRFAYRGFMLDVGRYFMPLPQIKKLVDLCVYHKINKFHIHITEDQGWRMEIKKYPLLTLKGSIRKGTNFSRKKHSGFYTQTQLKELVAYCKEKNIELIPEIDMPGHTQSALACYPYLSCFDRNLNVAHHWGVKHDIMCAGKESTFEFVKNVLDEVCDVFESDYIHIGGDEAPKTRWKLCPHCQQRIKDENLKNEEELQSYFTNRVYEYLKSKGKKAVMWNEASPTGITNKEVIWQLWAYPENKESTFKEFDEGRQYINSDSMKCYLDLPEKTVSLKSSYEFNPVITNDKSRLVGVEACLWSEYVPDYKKALHMTLPRLSALSEVMWTDIDESQKDYRAFLKRLDSHTMYLLDKGYPTTSYSNSVLNKTRQFFEFIWFNRRPLHWEGLHILKDNKKVAKLAKKLNKKTK